jgi:hypothetical protein
MQKRSEADRCLACESVTRSKKMQKFDSGYNDTQGRPSRADAVRAKALFARAEIPNLGSGPLLCMAGYSSFWLLRVYLGELVIASHGRVSVLGWFAFPL